MKRTIKGFTLVEMLIVIVAVGIMGSMTVRLLYQGSDLFVNETNRQSFVNEIRSVYWRIIRETHGQVSKSQFTSSSSNTIYIMDANDEQAKQILTSSPPSIVLNKDGVQNTLSNYYSSSSRGITYYDNNYNIISFQNGLSEEQAKTIHLVEINFIFANNEDNLSLSSYVFPHNFKYGEKMGYHE